MAAIFTDAHDTGNRLRGDPYEEGEATNWNLGRRKNYAAAMGHLIARAHQATQFEGTFGKASAFLLEAAMPLGSDVPATLYSETLSARETRRYVGEYQHLDRWADLGRVDIVASYEAWPDDDENIEDRHVVHQLAIVTLPRADGPRDEDEIRQAIRDTFTKWGCGHEYDCCGCWLRSCLNPEPLLPLPDDANGDIRRVWAIPVGYSRNY